MQVWLTVEMQSDGSLVLHGDSDSKITKGLCAVLIRALSGMTAPELLKVIMIPIPATERLGFLALPTALEGSGRRGLEILSSNALDTGKEKEATDF
jgi:sulfur transfer protein SufE